MAAQQKQGAGKSGNLKCGNCSIWVSPVWRYQKTLQMLLCNACSCCYAAKGVHRVRPSMEQLEKIAQAFEAKQTRNQAALTSGNGLGSQEDTTQNTRLLHGKRKRQPRTWGADVITYQEEEKGSAEPQTGRADRHKVERAEFDMYKRWSETHYNSSDASDEEELSPRLAAEILTSMKYAKIETFTQPSVGEARRVQPSSTGFTSGVDGMVYLSLVPSQLSDGKLNKPVRLERSCSKCGTTETPTWRKAGGNLDLCNACGVRISAKARHARLHPPLPIKPISLLNSSKSLPIGVQQPHQKPLPKANSMPVNGQRQESERMLEQMLRGPGFQLPAPVNIIKSQLPSAKPLKDLDYVAAAKFSPFHEWNSTRPKERSTVIYRPPQRSLFQLVDPKLQTQPKTQQLSGVPPKFDESRVFRPIPELASQSSNFSNESVLQNASYFYSQESLYG